MKKSGIEKEVRENSEEWKKVLFAIESCNDLYDYMDDVLHAVGTYEDVLEHYDSDDAYRHFGADDLLDEMSDDEIIDYLKSNGYKVEETNSINPNCNEKDEIKYHLLEAYRMLRPYMSYIDKEDVKKELKEFIDFWL